VALQPQCVEVGVDNRAALFLVEDPISAARTKHIAIIHHHVRKKVRCRLLKVDAVPTAENPADAFTKPLPKAMLEKHRISVGVVPQLRGIVA
jgi:hypothetical protein